MDLSDEGERNSCAKQREHQREKQEQQIYGIVRKSSSPYLNSQGNDSIPGGGVTSLILSLIIMTAFRYLRSFAESFCNIGFRTFMLFYSY